MPFAHDFGGTLPDARCFAHHIWWESLFFEFTLDNRFGFGKSGVEQRPYSWIIFDWIVFEFWQHGGSPRGGQAIRDYLISSSPASYRFNV
jgi:hypothetical protein